MVTPKKLTLLTAIFLASAGNAPAMVIHVWADATGTGTGTSWENAMTSLPDALAAATAGDEVWVARGTYRAPTPTLVNPETPPFPGASVGPLSNTTAAFVFPAGVKVIGGFAATEPSAANRNIAANPTILLASCLDAQRAAFVYRSEAELLDGFIIDGESQSAGGMFGAWTLNCVFRSCQVTPPYIFGSISSQPGAALTVTGRVERCVFEGNVSSTGAPLSVSQSEIVQCRVTGNRNLGETLGPAKGAGIYSSGSRFTSCLIDGNRIENGSVTSSSAGAGIFGSAMLINCTITANSITHAVAGAISGGGAHLEGSSLVYNCIVWGNAGGANSQLADASPSGFGPITVSHSIVQGGFPGTGVLDQDPLFANSTAGDFRPVPGAPGLDIGAPESLAGLADRDLDDKPRSIPALAGFPPLPDLGAYEFGDYAEVLNIVIGPNRKARLDIRSSLSDGLRIEATTNLLDWIDLGPPDPNGAQLIFRDQEAPTIGRRFYRFESP